MVMMTRTDNAMGWSEGNNRLGLRERVEVKNWMCGDTVVYCRNNGSGVKGMLWSGQGEERGRLGPLGLGGAVQALTALRGFRSGTKASPRRINEERTPATAPLTHCSQSRVGTLMTERILR